MTPEERQIKIGELCGWKHYGCTGCSCSPCVCDEWIHEMTDGVPVMGLPDYLNDLNAMHAAEKTLIVTCDGTEDGCECYRYIRLLHEVIGGVPNCFAHHCATAEQRATAFLLTKGITP